MKLHFFEYMIHWKKENILLVEVSKAEMEKVQSIFKAWDLQLFAQDQSFFFFLCNQDQSFQFLGLNVQFFEVFYNKMPMKPERAKCKGKPDQLAPVFQSSGPFISHIIIPSCKS